MALTISVRLREDRYDAAYPADQLEWPPHPARLFCALVASAEHNPQAEGHEADIAALSWLERAGQPLVLAVPPDAVEPSARDGYVVTNAVKQGGGSTAWPGRTNGRSGRLGALPANGDVAFLWPDASPDDRVLWRLHRLARRVPYLGRSTSSAEVTVHDEAPRGHESWVTYRPVSIGEVGAIPVRVPYPGYTERLRDAHDRGDRAWELSRTVSYRYQEDPPVGPVPASGPYPELLVWPVHWGGVPISGDRLLTITELLRRTVISRVADPVPAQVSGHGADGRPHLAYLPLLDAGHQHADGHLLGVAVAIPAGMTGVDRTALLRGLLGAEGDDPISELRGGAEGVFHLADPADPPMSWGLRPERWSGPPEGARRWVSLTPPMLDRYPGRRDWAEVLADGFVTAGYPRPASVTVLEAPLVRGAIRLPRRGTVPKGRPHRPMLHCRVEFAEPVRGPVLVGALRYLGCGLLVPEVSRADR